MTMSGTTLIYMIQIRRNQPTNTKAPATRVKCQRIEITQTKQEKKMHGIHDKRKHKRKQAQKIRAESRNNINNHNKFKPSPYTRQEIQQIRKIRANTLRDPATRF